MRKAVLLLALFLVPQSGHAQRTVFSSLLGGYVTYRPTAAWRVLRTVQDPQGEGVVLTGRSPIDSTLSVLLIAYPSRQPGGFLALADSLLTALAPGQNPTRTWEGGNDTLRLATWTADSPNGRIIAIDRLLLLPNAILYARVAMPAIPPADPDHLLLRLQVIDDFLTSVHAEGRVLFPAGAQFAIKVF